MQGQIKTTQHDVFLSKPLSPPGRADEQRQEKQSSVCRESEVFLIYSPSWPWQISVVPVVPSTNTASLLISFRDGARGGQCEHIVYSKLVLWPRVGAQHQDAIKDHEKKSFEERIILKYCWNPFNKKKKCCHRFQLLTCEDFSQISCGPVVPFHIYSIRIRNISALMSTLCVFVYI